jgi:transposase
MANPASIHCAEVAASSWLQILLLFGGGGFHALGRPLGPLAIATTPAGYRRLLEWSRGLGSDPRFGIEGTGSYGAGLARFLVAAGCMVIEVSRPTRQTRSRRHTSG